jgi:hypothetical protein
VLVVNKARLITCHPTAERQQNIVAGRLTLDARCGPKISLSNTRSNHRKKNPERRTAHR